MGAMPFHHPAQEHRGHGPLLHGLMRVRGKSPGPALQASRSAAATMSSSPGSTRKAAPASGV